jgi:hypothetical protein
MISTGLKRVQVEALWNIAQSASLLQSEFFDALNQTGASGLLAKCIENGALMPTKPAKAEMNIKLMANMRFYTTSNY